MGTSSLRRFGAIGLLAIGLAACGTTVPQTTVLGSNQSGTTAAESATGVGGDGTGATDQATGGSNEGSTAGGSTTTPGASVPGTGTGTASGGPVTPGGTSAGGAVAPGGGSGSGTGARPGPVAAKPGPTTRTTVGASAKPTGSARPGTTGSAAPKAGSTATAAASGANTSPVSVGILEFGSAGDAAGSLGANNGNTFTGAKAADSLVAALNAQGGLAGRQISPVTYVIGGTDTNYETDLSAACAKFTQDNHVAFVVDPGGYYDDNFETCLAKANTPTVIAGYSAGDSAAYSTYPLMISDGSPSVDRRLTAMLSQSAATGWLTKTNKLGVLIDGCPYNVAAYNRTLVPLAKQLGVSVEQSTISCVTGYGSVGGATQGIQSAMLRFRTDMVDRIMVVSNFEAVAVLLEGQENESQQYHPGYILSSASGIAAEASNYQADQLTNMHGVGWIPSLDVTTVPAQNAAQKRCAALEASQGVSPASNTDLLYIYGACDEFFLPEAALKANGGNTSPSAFIAAIEGVGSTYQSPEALATETFGPGHHDGPSQVAAFSYAPGCSCFSYQQKPTALP